MNDSSANPIGQYFSKLNTSEKAELQRIREIVNVTVPEAKETISYGMPAFEYKGKYLVGFYVYKNHLSLFPTSKPIEAFKNKLKDFQLSKGTIQFTLKNTIPAPLIRNIILYRIDEIDKSDQA
jgi:uncharacterized protein YdhG (YjbR/CyaY superfamily)